MDSTDEGGGTSGITTRSRTDADNPEEGTSGLRRRERLVHHYGKVQGVEVGSTYISRIELKLVHRPLTYWIHLGPEGPYSLIVQGEKRFLDEGTLIVISTKETKETEVTDEKKSSVVGNLMKALKSRLPIRVVRVLKTEPDALTVYRYDGLYAMKKKIILRGKLHFLLRRNKNQPEMQYNFQHTSRQIRHMLALKKKFSRKKKRSICVKKEVGIKKEIVSTSEPERDNNGRTFGTFCWEQFKEEVTLAEEVNEEVTYVCDDNDYEIWQGDTVIKGDSYNENEDIDEPSFLNYHQSVQKVEMYYQYGDEIVDLDVEEVGEHVSKENVIIETIPVVKCENGENSDDLRTILAIVPESGTSEFVKEPSAEDVDPLNVSDPLDSDNNDSKNSCEEKKSAELFPPNSENNKNPLATYQTYHSDLITPVAHPCLYNLTLGQLFNLVGGTPEPVCPCKLPRSSAQQHFEGALRGMFEEREKLRLKCIDSCDDCIKPFETIEGKGFYPINNLFEQLSTVLVGKTNNELQAPLIVKRKCITTNRILKKEKKRTRKFHVKKLLSVEQSLVTNEDCSSTPLPYISPDSLGEDEVNTPEQLLQSPEESQQLDISDVEPDAQPKKGRRKKRKGYETTYLGPMIPPENDSPRSRNRRKLPYKPGGMFSTSHLRRSHRSTTVHSSEWEGEEENRFLGFMGPIRPPSRLRLIKTYLKKYCSKKKK